MCINFGYRHRKVIVEPELSFRILFNTNISMNKSGRTEDSRGSSVMYGCSRM
jgi:hypothetical protein